MLLLNKAQSIKQYYNYYFIIKYFNYIKSYTLYSYFYFFKSLNIFFIHNPIRYFTRFKLDIITLEKLPKIKL